MGVEGSDGEGEGERDRGGGGVAGSRSVRRQMVKRGGTVMDGGVGERTGEDVGLAGGAGVDRVSGGCGVSGVGRVNRWKDVETTWERAASRFA